MSLSIAFIVNFGVDTVWDSESSSKAHKLECPDGDNVSVALLYCRNRRHRKTSEKYTLQIIVEAIEKVSASQVANCDLHRLLQGISSIASRVFGSCFRRRRSGRANGMGPLEMALGPELIE